VPPGDDDDVGGEREQRGSDHRRAHAARREVARPQRGRSASSCPPILTSACYREYARMIGIPMEFGGTFGYARLRLGRAR
jgi:hypothetical protein